MVYGSMLGQITDFRILDCQLTITANGGGFKTYLTYDMGTPQGVRCERILYKLPILNYKVRDSKWWF
jgi:hypothetical protein